MENNEVDFAEWKIFMLLSELYAQGGHIIRLYGNHELMLVSGNAKYRTVKARQNDRKRAGRGSDMQLWSGTVPGVYNHLMSSCGGGKAVVRINNWIFCHGGLTPSYIRRFILLFRIKTTDRKQQGDIVFEKYNELINKIVLGTFDQQHLREKAFWDDHKNSQSPIFDNTILWSRFNGNHEFDQQKCNDLVKLMDDLFPDGKGKTRLCIGHCVQNTQGIDHTEYLHSQKVFYNMTKIVSLDTINESSVVQKLGLPAARCKYDRENFSRIEQPTNPPGCFYIPAINFGCNGTNDEETYELGRVFRIDCSMSRGLQLRRATIVKYLNENKPASWDTMTDSSKGKYHQYLFEMYDAATSPQALEILANPETVHHVLATQTNMFKKLEL